MVGGCVQTQRGEGRGVVVRVSLRFRSLGVVQGADGASSYRYQLEAFVDKVRGRQPSAWRSAEDSIESMKAIDGIYTEVRVPASSEAGDALTFTRCLVRTATAPDVSTRFCGLFVVELGFRSSA